MKILAVVPARAGSKGIPNKNIRLVAGKPLVAYAIANALASKYITEVVVTTDSDMVLVPLIMAPAGGSITNFTHDGYGWISKYTLYGYDAYTGVLNADVGESVVFTYQVTTAPEATELLTVRKTPLAQERLLTIEYALEQ